jgi:hypothetical protein
MREYSREEIRQGQKNYRELRYYLRRLLPLEFKVQAGDRFLNGWPCRQQLQQEKYIAIESPEFQGTYGSHVLEEELKQIATIAGLTWREARQMSVHNLVAVAHEADRKNWTWFESAADAVPEMEEPLTPDEMDRRIANEEFGFERHADGGVLIHDQWLKPIKPQRMKAARKHNRSGVWQ